MCRGQMLSVPEDLAVYTIHVICSQKAFSSLWLASKIQTYPK